MPSKKTSSTSFNRQLRNEQLAQLKGAIIILGSRLKQCRENQMNQLTLPHLSKISFRN